MGIHLAEQTLSFVYACLLGAVLGVFYDVFRILRIAFPTGRGIIFVQDLFFWAVCAVASFLFLLTNIDGVVRMFMLAGELIGGVLYHFTVGQLVMRVAQSIISAVRAVLRFFYRFFFRPLWRLVYAIITFLLRPVRFFGQIMKKSLQRIKFRLKVRRIVLYNHLISYLSRRTAEKGPREKTVYGKENSEESARP